MTNYYSSYTCTYKPKKWKGIAPLTYVSDVEVMELFDDEDPRLFRRYETIGVVQISYKIKAGERTKLDEEWLKEKMINDFGKIYRFNTSHFSRDGAPLAFLSKIYMTKEEFIKIKREQKLQRIVNVSEK